MKVFWKSFALVTALFIMLGAKALAADSIVVVVNKKSKITSLTQAQVKALFLGETRSPMPGVTVELHDRDKTSAIFKEFYAGLASMTPKQVAVHWSRKVFAGEASPPIRDSGDDAAVVEAVKVKPDAINYIYEKNVNPSVRVIYSLKDR